MSPSRSQPTTKTNNNLNKGLKTNRVSHLIRKTSLSSSSSLSLSSLPSPSSNKPQLPPPPSNKPQQQQQRQPMIIYTHSPKIIETNPKNFMELVKKLMGLSHDNLEKDENEEKNNNGCSICIPLPQYPPLKQELVEKAIAAEKESSSIIINENNNCGYYSCMGEVKSGFAMNLLPTMMTEPPAGPYMSTIPLFAPNSTDFLYSNKPFLNYPEPLFFSRDWKG